jgi:hypothetical protein
LDATVSSPTDIAPAPVPVADAAPIPCPLCEYDLRGLAEPRCPECGYRFEWDELRDPRRRFHPWLFEHHPNRNKWSFYRTLTGGLAPAGFWSTLYPTQPSRPRRLLAYWGLTALPLAAAVAAHAWLNVTGMIAGLRLRGTPPASPWRTVIWVASYDRYAGATELTGLMCLTWPWLTLAALLVFQVSLRRARLRPTHVLRCVLYSGDVAFWLALLVALVAAYMWAGSTWPPPTPFGVAWPLVPAAVVLLVNYRLLTAYRRYLRFDHAAATVAASQVMVGLVYWKLWYVVQGL